MTRRLGSLERVWLAARAMDASFSLQLVCELDRELPDEAWREALDRLAELDPAASARLRGVLGWTRWVPGLGRARLGRIAGGDAAGWMEAPLLAPVELLVLSAQVPRVVLRCDHALVDGVGILSLLRGLFALVNGRVAEPLPLGEDDLSLARSLGHAGPVPGVDAVSPLGPPRSEDPGRVWAGLRVADRDRLLARAVRALFRASRRYAEGPLRVDVPVDLRRHGVAGSGNLTGLVQLDLLEEPSLDEVHARVQAALAGRRELDVILRMGPARWAPVSWLAGLGAAGARRSYRTDLWQSSCTLSHLGRWHLASFGGEQVRLRRLVPIAPGSRGLPLNLTFLADEEGLELSASAPRAVGGGRIEGFLEAFAEALG